MERSKMVNLLRYGGFGGTLVALVMMMTACFTSYYYTLDNIADHTLHFGVIEACFAGDCAPLDSDCSSSGIYFGQDFPLPHCTDFNTFRAFVFLAWIFMLFTVILHIAGTLLSTRRSAFFRYLGFPTGGLALIFSITALSRRPTYYIESDGRTINYGYSWGLNIIAVVFIAISNTAGLIGQCMYTPQAKMVHGYPVTPSSGSYGSPVPPGY